MKRLLLGICVAFLLIFVLVSCGEKQEIVVKYEAGEGGTIVGMIYQSKFSNERVLFEAVEAKPNDGYQFVCWSDGLGEARRQDELSLSATFTATFERLPLTIEYKASEGGYVEGEASQTLNQYENTTEVEAIASEGYLFVTWDDGNTNPKRSDIVTESRTHTAIFEKIPTATIHYSATEGGHVTGEREQTVVIGERTATVRAVASEGYRFMGWSDGNLSPERRDAPEADFTYTAIFHRYYNITVSSNNTDLGTVSGELSQTVADGENMSVVTATVTRQGYKFLCWSTGDTSPTLSITPSDDLDIKAIFVEDSRELPVLSINTEDFAPIVSKKEYLNCTVNATNIENMLFDEVAQVRGRGNTSWEESDKKPYKLKFNSKVDLFGHGEARDWTLIPNYTDKSLVRNYLAYMTAKEFSHLGETTGVTLVELWVNYEYRGVYLLCEQIEVAEDRVDVTKSYASTDTGYLIELDGRNDGIGFKLKTTLACNQGAEGTEYERSYVVKFPDPDSELFKQEHIDYIRTYIERCMRVLEDGSDYEAVCELIDVDSFAQAYIIFELFRGADVGWSSFFVHKDAGGKMECGPVWDFDRAVGNIDYNRDALKIDNLYAKNNNEWFYGLLKFDEFKALVTKYLHEYKSTIEATLSEEFNYILSCPQAFNRNFEKWDILDIYVRPNCSDMVKIKTWEGQVGYVRDYLAKSLEYMLSQYPNS